MSTLLAVLGGVLLLVVVPILVNLASAELTAWLPRWSEVILAAASRRLARAERARWLAEWRGELDMLPGDVSKLVYACDKALRCGRLAGVVGGARLVSLPDARSKDHEERSPEDLLPTIGQLVVDNGVSRIVIKGDPDQMPASTGKYRRAKRMPKPGRPPAGC